ncbi:alpha/beta fold hydrolase [Limnohabitans sp.]|uniref:alpha/beta fold hydrolase n=1 Tax=Limnohabitans sp. TaxID=1907725 RepID=UPI00286FAE6F|nr:alpha/beta fold hydrolase [Limnohabitans sp.]
MYKFLTVCLSVWMLWQSPTVLAQTFPHQKSEVWIAKDFRFHTGEISPALNIGYTTLGNPAGEVVVILHGTTGTGAGMLNPAFGGELFGPGQPLDASKYFIVLPDAIGTGKSSKPSDGLRAQFPRYNYDDMVSAQYRLLTEGLRLKRVRMILGNSMGGMQTWLWGIQHPEFMDILAPMASMPSEMSGRNWLMRRLIIDAIRKDPDWMNGNYTQQPRSLQFASVFYAIGTNGGHQGLQRLAPTREKADQLLNQRLSAPFAGDANDHLYQWEASRDYNPLDQLEKIKATLLAINSADDERNPPELNVMSKALSRIPNARLLLIPASDQTAGHGTTGQAKWWKHEVGALIQTAPRR